MKRITYLLSFIITAQISFGQTEKVKKVTTEINSAIIYLDGAEIHRNKKVSLEKGRTKVVFTGLSPKFNANNIQVTTTNGIDLLAISHKIDYLTNIKEKPKVQALKDSVKFISEKNIALNNDKDAYSIEKDMLLQNKKIGGNNNGVSIAELKQAADLFRARIMEINKAIAKIDKGVNTNNETINRINNELYQLNAKTTYSRGEITLLLNAETPTTTEIDLKYIVTNAGWIPVYDIKTEDINKLVEISYRAKVYNNTDIDWKNLKFKLSTGNPKLSATQPKLSPWYLNYNNQYKKQQKSYGYKKAKAPAYQQQNQDKSIVNPQGLIQNQIYEANNAVNNSNNNQFVELAVSELSAEFEIEKSYYIPSDNQPYIVDVVEYEVPALFKHYSVPKLDRDAFLIARIPNWQDLNLIEGNANIYFAGTYVGQSFISTRSVNDTLDISLGRDKKVIVTRTKIEEFSSKKVIGSNRKETHAYRMIVKNNRKVPINIEVLGQVPVSQDSDIEVSAEEISDATKNDLNGELKWKHKIEAGQSRTINLTFTVKYPKSKPVKVKREVYRSVRFL